MPGMSQTIFNNGYDSGYGSGYGNGILDLVNDGDISVERAAEKLHKTPDEIQKLLNDFLSSKKTIRLRLFQKSFSLLYRSYIVLQKQETAN